MQTFLSTIGIILLLCWDVCSQDQSRSAITGDNVTEVMRMGSLSSDVAFVGPHSEPGRVVMVTRRSEIVFDSRSSGFVEQPTLMPLVFDDTSLKQKGNLERHSQLSSVSRDGKRCLWSREAAIIIESEEMNTEILDGFTPRVSGSAFHPVQDLVAIHVWEHDPMETDCLMGFSTVRLFTNEGQLVHKFDRGVGGAAKLEFSSDGRFLAVANRNAKHTQVLSLKRKSIIHTFSGSSAPKSIAFHPGGKWLAVLEDKQCRIWNAKDGKLVRAMEISSHKGSGKVLWSPSGDMLLTATDGKIKFWSSRSWEKVHEIKLAYQGVTELMMTPDGSRLISETKSIEKWNPKAHRVETWGIR